MSIEERKLNLINKTTALNPNAVEFVPSCLRSVSDASNRPDTTKFHVSGSSKDTSADKPESAVPSNPDEEAHRYWQDQLPDDITPDFNVLGQDETPGHDSLSLAGLSMNDGFASSIFSPNQTPKMHHASPFVRDALGARARIEFSGPEQPQGTIMSPTASTMSPTAAPWVKTVRNGGQYGGANRRDASHYNGDSSIGSPLQSDAYYRNRRSFRSTMDIMTQLEQNKVDGRLNQNLRGSQLLGGSYNGNHGMVSNSTLQNTAGVQTGPTWLETDATANMFSEKDDIHDFASLRHALLEQQDRQAFLTGGNPLAKELNIKELYSIQSRLDQEKARETLYQQRFQMPELQGLIQEQNPPIDLCGLHASEAMQVLNYELNNRRKIARSTGRRLQAIIIASARTPARMTAAVEQYLMEHGLQYTQAQPGIFRVLLQ
ncbi:polyadenylate-binding protein-interacting protein 7-like isoform X3 [Lolium rigidum]|uniref:polyadenylate-binding protein-interacting protein 7-like isoform X3 n=1 Tax=Lolium rigidum TaxID=89674 RepID=UPI001F5E28B3|nr:polyadenylate-binding protein-interacting protein 7-like isoform X3 [Lolium rigidum]